MKTIIKKIAAMVAILVDIAFRLLLLLARFSKILPLVLTVWLLSAVYFVFIKNRLCTGMVFLACFT